MAQRKRKIVGLCFGLKQVLVDATISMTFTIFSFSFFVSSLTSQRPNKEKDIVVDFIKRGTICTIFLQQIIGG